MHSVINWHMSVKYKDVHSEQKPVFAMKVFLIYFGLLFCVYADDPCLNYTPIDDWRRSLGNDDLSPLLCDSMLQDGWYRSVSNAGNQIPTECPHGGFRCGTVKPIWINGSLPTSDVITNITACVSDFNGCCSKSYDIQIKKCSGYYVYHLFATEGCAEAFCFGTELPCQTGYSSKTGFTPGCTYDPCLSVNYKEIDEWSRSVGNDNSNEWTCDLFLEPGWYRPISKAGNSMSTQCPIEGFTCGTGKPIWLNGNHPLDGEIVNVTACAVSYGNCCSHSYDIQVKNCSTFNVYNLVPTSGCPQGYCFGTELPCQTGYSSKTGFTPGCTYDPCLSVNHKEIDEWSRSVGNNNSNEWTCDLFLEPGWYRPISKAGNSMPTQCPIEGFTCGTGKPIWLNGHHPQDSEIINMTACAVSYGNCCSHSYDIQVKNCSTFNVYNLVPTSGCPQGYCFGSEIPCPEGYSSENGFTPGCEFDPCNEINYATLTNQVKRSSNYTLQSTDEPFDDSNLDRGWYRINSATGNDIVNTKPTTNSCGTKFPIWMKGEIPSVTDKTTSRVVCITDDTGNCKLEFSIQVRNCGTFRTYFLEKVNTQYAGYCFGIHPVKWSTATKPPKKETKTYAKILIPILIVVVILAIGVSTFMIHKKCIKRVDVLYKEKPDSQPPPYLNNDHFVLEAHAKSGLQTSLYSRGFIKA